MGQLSPHHLRTVEPFERHPFGYRRQSLPDPQHCGPLVPLRTEHRGHFKRRPCGAVSRFGGVHDSKHAPRFVFLARPW
ncbi:hypothetical protein Q4481_08125 [Rhizobium alvei]|uniref:Uncharacterized protein n=1 Tax=Rhizobium alvei TaxID=1132659 RepID=A0ABT8YKA9_9HYPH|nr:hypothetical protein [Rhizobium alvei]MDO6963922.1 hypothetical protein [Rhizobium alvei]